MMNMFLIEREKSFNICNNFEIILITHGKVNIILLSFSWLGLVLSVSLTRYCVPIDLW